MVLFCLATGAEPALAQSGLIVEGGLFLDSGTREDEVLIGPSRNIDRADVSNIDLGFVTLAYLHQLGAPDGPRAGFRVGGELRYLGQYTTERSNDAREVVGALIEVGARADWSTPITSDLAFFVAARAAMALAFPSGDLATEIDRMVAEGISAGHGPRPGVTLMPSVGVRYGIHERVELLAGLGLGWSWLSVFSIDETVSGIRYIRDESISNTRFELAFGVAITL